MFDIKGVDRWRGIVFNWVGTKKCILICDKGGYPYYVNKFRALVSKLPMIIKIKTRNKKFVSGYNFYTIREYNGKGKEISCNRIRFPFVEGGYV